MPSAVTQSVSIHVTDRDHRSHRLDWEHGQSMMEVLRDADLPILASCGGCCSCATCHVLVAPDWIGQLSAATKDELDLLSETSSFDDARSRLSCQIAYSVDLDGITVELAADS